MHMLMVRNLQPLLGETILVHLKVLYFLGIEANGSLYATFTLLNSIRRIFNEKKLWRILTLKAYNTSQMQWSANLRLDGTHLNCWMWALAFQQIMIVDVDIHFSYKRGTLDSISFFPLLLCFSSEIGENFLGQALLCY